MDVFIPGRSSKRNVGDPTNIDSDEHDSDRSVDHIQQVIDTSSESDWQWQWRPWRQSGWACLEWNNLR